MRPLRSLLLFLAGILIGGAWLAPFLYWLTQWAAQEFPAFQRMAHNPFHRFVNRSVLGLAVLGMWPFLRSLGIRSWEAVGLVKPTGQWKKLAGGFALGFGSLACVALLALAAGA